MITISDRETLRREVRRHRLAEDRIGFVPTMGNLHEGHLALVREARSRSDCVVASIYVNPLQFGADEDLSRYPRTPEEDARALQRESADILFIPDDRTMYPRGLGAQTKVEVPGLGNILCGAARPGHFIGVATVVNRLLNMVQPDVAVFGKKDYQQLAVIRTMVEDLAMPIEIVGVDTVRDHDGLALSSRNVYLSPEHRAVAPLLYRSLQDAAARLAENHGELAEIERSTLRVLENGGFRPDYVSVRRQEDLQPPQPADRQLVILAAAWLGPARLIDNVEVIV